MILGKSISADAIYEVRDYFASIVLSRKTLRVGMPTLTVELIPVLLLTKLPGIIM